MNYFEFYGIEPSFYPNEQEIQEAYYAKMRELHPDLNMHLGEAERQKMELLSGTNNIAYNTLVDFHKRLEYILEEYHSTPTEAKKSLPQAFLMEMMDTNEEIMDLQFDYDATKAALIQEQINTQGNQMLDVLESELQNITIAKGLSQQTVDLAQDYLMKRNYLRRILENLDKLK